METFSDLEEVTFAVWNLCISHTSENAVYILRYIDT